VQILAHSAASGGRCDSPERARSALRSLERARREDDLGSPTRRRSRASISADHVHGNLRLSPSLTICPPSSQRRDRSSSPPAQNSVRVGTNTTNLLNRDDEVRSCCHRIRLRLLTLRSLIRSANLFVLPLPLLLPLRSVVFKRPRAQRHALFYMRSTALLLLRVG
jgi:hypothetical protein